METFVKQLAKALDQLSEGLTAESRLSDIPNRDSPANLTTLPFLDETHRVTRSSAQLRACTTMGDRWEKGCAAVAGEAS